MLYQKNENQAMSLNVTDELSVTIIPNSEYEFLISTKDVAAGYGVSTGTVRRHSQEHLGELIEGQHFIKGVQNLNTLATKGVNITDTLPNAQPHQVFWTKAGVIRLGFFIKSERAKLFRDWAEQLILAVVGHKQPLLPAVTKRKHNRLTAERIIDILSDVCLIENRELRERIANKITGGPSHVN